MAVHIKRKGARGQLPGDHDFREREPKPWVSEPPPKKRKPIKVSMKQNPKANVPPGMSFKPSAGLPKGKADPEKANLSTEELNDILAEEGVPVDEAWERRRNAQPGERIRATDEERAYRLKQILRLLLRGVPRKTISEHLGLSLKQLEKDIVELNKQVKDEVSNLDFPLFIGMTLNFFDEARNIALRTATDTKETSNMTKMKALETAMKAEVEKHKYLQLVGLYNNPIPEGTFGSIGGPSGSTHTEEADVKQFLALVSGKMTLEAEVVEKEFVPSDETMETIIHEIGLMDRDVEDDHGSATGDAQ